MSLYFLYIFLYKLLSSFKLFLISGRSLSSLYHIAAMSITRLFFSVRYNVYEQNAPRCYASMSDIAARARMCAPAAPPAYIYPPAALYRARPVCRGGHLPTSAYAGARARSRNSSMQQHLPAPPAYYWYRVPLS